MTTALPPRVVLSSLDAATLRPLVVSSRSWRQVLLAVGLRNRHVPQVRSLCDRWGIGYEHLGLHAPPDAALRAVLTTAASWPEALTRLGYAGGSGSARATLRAHATRLGLDVTRLAAPAEAGSPPCAVQHDRRHLRQAGTYLVAAVLALGGHAVSWPLEPAPYDLLVDTGQGLLRVQVKTTSRKVGGSWNCAITRSVYADVPGGKRRARYDESTIDAFAVVDGDGDVYLIPVAVVAGRAALSLSRFVAFRLPRFGQGFVSG